MKDTSAVIWRELDEYNMNKNVILMNMDWKGCWNNVADSSNLIPSLMSCAELSLTFLLRGSASAFPCFGIGGEEGDGSPGGGLGPCQWLDMAEQGAHSMSLGCWTPEECGGGAAFLGISGKNQHTKY